MKVKVVVSLMLNGVVEVDMDPGEDGVGVTNLSESRCAQHAFTINHPEMNEELRNEVCAYASLKVLTDVLKAQRAEVRALADGVPNDAPEAKA